MEAAPHAPGAALDAAGAWRVVRICTLAHDLDRWERTAPHWHSGVYCFAPVGGEGPCRAVFDGVEIREGAPLPVSQATNIPADIPADDDPDDISAAKPRGCDPDDDPDGKYPSDWPYHQAEAHEFL